MTTKYMKLVPTHFLLDPKVWLNFKWQWSVHWEKKVFNTRIRKWEWIPRYLVVDNRNMARYYRRVHLRELSDRNVVIKRRRVQVNWETYSDSFSYNEKGNGNGR